MPGVSPFYSINEASKLADKRRYHNNGACPPGRDIPQNERKQGTGEYSLCDICNDLNKQGR